MAYLYQLLKTIPRQYFTLVLLLLGLLLLGVALVILMEPYILYRLVSKTYVNYEIKFLKYPNSYFVGSATRSTSKVTMATDYTYRTSDDTDTVRDYMERQIPGFAHVQRVHIIEPTYINSSCVDDVVLDYFFQLLNKASPCIRIEISPVITGGTSIIVTEHWNSMGVSSWLRQL